MRVVQLAGPSYSGSTVLGYVLNAEHGWFFGSEVYRMLPAWATTPERQRRARCAHCGEECRYWNAELRDRMAALPSAATVAEVYRLFHQTHPHVRTFVDGSKELSWLAPAWGEVQVVTAKHPLRMVASYLYNRSERFDLPHEPSFRQFRRVARERHDDMVAMATRVLTRLRREYEELLQQAPNPVTCRTDELHIDDFAELRRLSRSLHTGDDPRKVTAFSSHEVHPVGGNRALVWASQERGMTLTKAERDGVRRRYYVQNEVGPLGDYRVDDKYAQLLTPSLREAVTRLAAYRNLSAMLRYASEPVPGPAASG